MEFREENKEKGIDKYSSKLLYLSAILLVFGLLSLIFILDFATSFSKTESLASLIKWSTIKRQNVCPKCRERSRYRNTYYCWRICSKIQERTDCNWRSQARRICCRARWWCEKHSIGLHQWRHGAIPERRCIYSSLCRRIQKYDRSINLKIERLR